MHLTVAEIRKFVVAVIGAAAEAVNAGLVPANIAKWVGIVIAVATAAGVYAVPNGASVPETVPPAK